MKAVLAKKELIAEGTWYVEFKLEEKLEFIPGQFFRLLLIDPRYKDERGNKRYLGFVNLPNDQNVAASITRMGPSAFKRSLSEAQAGMEVEIDGIEGKMTLPQETDKEIVIVTGGIGIAPIMSILRYERQIYLNRKIQLIYSNTNRARAIFMEELADFEKQNPNFKLITTMTQDPDWGGETRRFDTQFFKEKINLQENNLYYVTGTPRFVLDMLRYLRNIGVNQSDMKFEIFTGY